MNQLNALSELGHEVCLFSYEKGKVEKLHASISQHQWQDRVKYAHRMPTSYFKRLRFMLWYVRTYWSSIRFWDFMRSFNMLYCGSQALNLKCFFDAAWFLDSPVFDIIHVHFGPNAERIGKLRSRGFVRKSKLVATFHGFDLVAEQTFEYPNTYQNIWNHFDLLTVNTPYLEHILKQLPVSEPKIAILPMGLDTEYFQPPHKQKLVRPFHLLFVGRLIPLKGIDLAIRALATLIEEGEKGVTLTIIGQGPMEEELRSLSQSFSVTENVQFLGARTQEEVKIQMERCHVLLMPGRPDPETGREETQGLVIQEAQAIGLPVVVSDSGGMHYGIKDEVTGYVFQSENLEQLLRCIRLLMKEGNGYEQMSRNARVHAVEHYDYRILGKQLDVLYQQLMV